MGTKSKSGPIDIKQEIVDLYSREQLLAFFEFTLEPVGSEPISGLCRISKPKHDSSALRYLSLSFLVDTPDEAGRRAAQEALSAIEGDALKTAMRQVTDVIPLPHMHVSPDTYMVQLDLFIQGKGDEKFIVAQLVSAIERFTKIRTTDIEWWEASSVARETPIPPQAADIPHGPSLIASLTKWLRG